MMHFIAITIIALNATNEIPLPGYTLEAVTVNEPVENPHMMFSETGGVAASDLPTSHTQYVLQLTDSGTRVPLGKEVNVASDPHRPFCGMNPKSFKCYWARPGQVLVASWSTHGISEHGHWCAQGLVALNRSDDGWKVVLRTFAKSLERSSWEYRFKGGIYLAEDPRSDGLLLRLESHCFSTSKSPRPLFRRINESNPEEALWGTTIHEVTEWPCNLQDGSLRFGQGTKYLDLQEEIYPAQEVAEYVAAVQSAAQDQQGEIGPTVDEPQALNSQLPDLDASTNRVKTGHVPPYEPVPIHHWNSLYL